jgi:ribosomal protein L21
MESIIPTFYSKIRGVPAVAFAIIRTGGKRFRVGTGEVVRLPFLAGKNAGDTVEFNEVLIAGGDDGVRLGLLRRRGASLGTVVKSVVDPNHRLQVQATQAVQA